MVTKFCRNDCLSVYIKHPTLTGGLLDEYAGRALVGLRVEAQGAEPSALVHHIALRHVLKPVQCY